MNLAIASIQTILLTGGQAPKPNYQEDSMAVYVYDAFFLSCRVWNPQVCCRERKLSQHIMW